MAINPKTGEILTMVGSRDYFGKSYPEDCTSGVNCLFDPQVNVAALNPGRQPGSAFKPFVYATAFAKGYTPETVVFDLETQFHTGCDADGVPLYESVKEEECYKPINYDEKFRGPVKLKDALAQSINVPAVKVLYLAGLKDSLNTAKKMGITTLADINRYGLTLVLGGGEVSLLEMTSAYGVFANEGVRVPYTGILKVEDRNGNTLETFTPREERILDANIARTISDILSNEEARIPAFGRGSYLYVPGHTVAVKTGTTNDYKDAWIVGYTPTLAVGAWAGNNDNTPMEKRVAGFIVAPLWNEFMRASLASVPEEPFKKPEVAAIENLKPILKGEWRGGEAYIVDKISQKLATIYTPEETKEERVIPDIHSILYWVDKNNPQGPRPEKPENDPQFLLWEIPVLKWVTLQNGAQTTGSKPTEYDTIHKPEFAPRVIITGVQSTTLYDPAQKITFTVQGVGKYAMQKTDVFINGVFFRSAQKAPFVFSFVPNDVPKIKKENEIRVVVYDSVMNKREQVVIMKTQTE